jgi:hypothetical protein
MSHRLPALIAWFVLTGVASDVSAQSIALSTDVARGPGSGGHVHGTVTDQVGRTLDGVSILALGSTLIAVKSDPAGRFSLLLPPGTYVLRAMRDGYVSLLRESISVSHDVPVKKNITLVRFEDGAQPGVEDAEAATIDAGADGHSHSERAWRLRQLPRTILRETASVSGIRQDIDRPATTASFFSASRLVGQVNLLTTSALSGTTGRPDGWPHGAAYVSVGAPVGSHGDWSIRGSIASGAIRAWTFRGDYSARDARTHRVRVGFFHSGLEPHSSDTAPQTAGMATSRSVGRLDASDRWRVSSRLQLDLGARFDRYDYLADAGALSPRASARVLVLPRTFVLVSAAYGVTAPGRDLLLPLSSSGVWLPPARTFSALAPRSPLRAEHVRHYDIAVEHELGADRARSIGLRRFTQSTVNQLSMLFGLDEASQVGHYYVASSGDVDLDGWAMALRGRIAGPVSGRIEYTTAAAAWAGSPDRKLAYRNPSAARTGRERLHDLASAVDVSIPETSTNVTLAYRINSAFSVRSRTDAAPVNGGRFMFEVRQALPYQPLEGGSLSLVFAIRTLQHEDEGGGSFYDELLTVGPPTRIAGGLQVWF